jgi:hypothetical protein
MIDIEIKETGKKVQIKNQWNELDQTDFLFVSGLLWKVFNNKLSLIDLRLKLFYYFTDFEYKKKKYTDDEAADIATNIYRISEQITFSYTQSGDEFIFNFDIDRFFILTIDIDTIEMKGLTFNINDNGIISTDMTAEEFVDAYNFYVMFENSKNIGILKYMALIFLRPVVNGKKIEYSSVSCIQNAMALSDIDSSVLFGCYIQFAGLMNFILKRTNYALLFKGDAQQAGKISIGLAETIYSLSKTGYGSKSEIAKLNLFEYLDLLLKETLDYVKELNAMEKTYNEISELTGLSIDQITRII